MSIENLLKDEMDGRVLDPSPFVQEYLSHLGVAGRINARIHEDDEMLKVLSRMHGVDADINACRYFGLGKQLSDYMRHIVEWRFGSFRNVSSFLDFASGYGRVTRYLIQHINPERVWVSDISATAVEFQKANLGVHGFVSAHHPSDLNVTARFDCILVVSLFTHLPESTFVRWLEKLYSLLAPGGLLIISTHDISLRGQSSDSPVFFFDEESEIDTLDKREYGSTTLSEAYVRKAIEKATGGAAWYHRIPRALGGHQDAYLIGPGPKPDVQTLGAGNGLQGHVETVKLKDGCLEISGWAFDPYAVIRNVRVLLGGKLIDIATVGLRRNDVADVLGNSDAMLSGFTSRAQLRSGIDMVNTAPLGIFAAGLNGEHIPLYYDRLEAALRERHG